jgi:glycosyltransferase involved in cell wall biosynthesis
MRVSVIVPTYKRPKSLSRCLDALLRQDMQPDEILVVARPEDIASHEVVRRRTKLVRLVKVEQPGVIAAMNIGVDASTGDVVALTDDDSEPHTDWIRRIVTMYTSDSQIAAVGGRDLVYNEGQLEKGSERVVGLIDWFGRITGNHHMGVGPPRDVDILKGVNLSVKGELLRHLRFDERLRGLGTEHHWELSLCLTLRRLGFRIVYDPCIAVDHHPQPRIEGERALNAPVHVRNATHNETLALLEYLPAWRRPVYLVWAITIGTSTAPGLAQTIRSLVKSGIAHWPLLGAALAGRALGVRTYLCLRHDERPSPEVTDAIPP